MNPSQLQWHTRLRRPSLASASLPAVPDALRGDVPAGSVVDAFGARADLRSVVVIESTGLDEPRLRALHDALRMDERFALAATHEFPRARQVVHVFRPAHARK